MPVLKKTLCCSVNSESLTAEKSWQQGNMWGDMPISLVSTAIVTTDYRSLPLLLTLITLSLD